MSELAIVLRAAEVAGPLLGRLVGLIADAMRGGADEEAATREALEKLAGMPDLVPVGPDVERILREARDAT
jgi:hypothetical protein